MAPNVADADVLYQAHSEDIAPPATKLKTASLLSPNAARTYYGSSVTHTTGLALATSPEIIELAKALRGARDVTVPVQRDAFALNIENYIRNNINTEFRYGLSKGGRGALIDQSGTAFDQADLMVSLLREEGVSATFVVGDVTLTAAQFGKWSGLVKNLDNASQTFTVDATSACQMLADGGIPAIVNGTSSCAGLSGDLTSVVMSHVWVRVAGTDYDPAFKLYSLRSGIDLPAAMGCGTESASTCGSIVSTAGMTGATQATTAGGIPYIDHYNLDQAITSAKTLKTNLATYIKTNNINGEGFNASVFDVLGGRQLKPQSLSNTPLSYSVTATWAGGVPNQFRTKLSVKTDSCGSFFADEIAGRALLYKQYIQYTTNGFTVDGQSLDALSYIAATTCSATASPYIQIAVDHPYAAQSGGYADEVVNFKPVDPPADESGFYRPWTTYDLYDEGGAGVTPRPYNGQYHQNSTDWPEQNYLSLVPIMIVHNFGEAGLSAQKHMSDQMAVTGQSSEKCSVTTVGDLAFRQCDYNPLAVVAETFASMRGLTDPLVDGVAKTITTRHHDVGIVYAGRAQGVSILSSQESMSIAATSGSASDRQASFDMNALILAEAESRANSIEAGGGISAARAFFNHEYDTELSGTSAKIFDIAPAQMASYVANLPKVASVTNPDGSTSYGTYCINYVDSGGTVRSPPGCWRQLALQDVANQGYSTLISEGGPGELFYKGLNERALTMWEYVKGGTAVGDAYSSAMRSTDVVDLASQRRKALSVMPASGNLTISAEPDIITGTGDFPYGLPFARSFAGTYREFNRYTTSYAYDGSAPAPTPIESTAAVTSGIDSQYHDRLGGGWVDNYQVRFLTTNDMAYQLGSENAFFASELIANLQITRDLGTSGTLSSKVGSLFAMNNLSRTAGEYQSYNTLLVNKGMESVVFHRAYDGSWLSSQEPDSVFTFDASLRRYTSRSGDRIDFSVYRYDDVVVNSDGNTLVGDPSTYSNYRAFKADQWTFPSGVIIKFNYVPIVLSTPPSCPNGSAGIQYRGQFGYLLMSVSNSFGRSLAFAYDTVPWVRQTSHQPCGAYFSDSRGGVYDPSYTYLPVSFNTYRLKSVQDENGRSVLFDSDGEPKGDSFTAADPLGLVTRYEYNASESQPDPSPPSRNDYQVRRWYTPGNTTTPYQTISYDSLFRVRQIADRLGHTNLIYPSGMFGSEQWKYTERADGEGNISVDQFDQNDDDIYTRDPTGNVVQRSFDNWRHVMRTVMPEGNAEERSYDFRGNLLQTCMIGKSRAGMACDPGHDLISKKSYVEGPLVLSCVNIITCNDVATETDERADVTNYSWDSTTGNLTQILKPGVWSPADNATIRPELDLSYSVFANTALLTGKTQNISKATGVKTTYDYDAGSHYALKEMVVDSDGLKIRTCLKFDRYGRLISMTNPDAGLTTCP